MKRLSVVQNMKLAIGIWHDIEAFCRFGLQLEDLLTAIYGYAKGLFFFHNAAKLGQLLLLVQICQKS